MYIVDLLNNKIYVFLANKSWVKSGKKNNLTIKDLTVISMKSAYSDTLTPPYYGNTGNLGD